MVVYIHIMKFNNGYYRYVNINIKMIKSGK